GEYNKCLLNLWSPERNIVRRVLDVETKNDTLRLQVQRLGQTKPGKLEICRERDRRTPTARRTARLSYQRTLRRVLERRFPGYKVQQLTTSANLERSFGPIYARGLIRQGQSAFAVLGVNGQETQASIDAALTFGILWLDFCRQSQISKCLVEGLKLFAPTGSSALIRERMVHLNQAAAKWHLYELDEHDDSLITIDISDRGNLRTRLVHYADLNSVRNRFAPEIARTLDLMPEAEVAVLSAGEIAFRCHGLEFAKARLACQPGSFRNNTEIVFGLGAEERSLDSNSINDFTRLINSIGEVRHAEGPRDHTLWRMHSERWLESLVIKNVGAIDERLSQAYLYSQVPAFSASDRAMIDVLTSTRDGQLAVVELKADEDIHLPLQGIDYWARVSWHHSRGEFHKFGYFQGGQLSTQAPLLFLVAPALHIHPATDTLLRYISPEIDWTLVAIDERWREEIKVVFRKRSHRIDSTQNLPLSA
ncbi:MAG TPA: hypothetical protein VLK33_20710, partial [Terriglobales bacterium]|nr:hypothetical protein [Terriglobales bacterium]